MIRSCDDDASDDLDDLLDEDLLDELDDAYDMIADLRGRLRVANAELARVRALVPRVRDKSIALGAIDEDALPGTAAKVRGELDAILADVARDRS